MDTISVAGVWRYPFKGFAGESLDGQDIEQGKGIPYDRRWGVVDSTARKEVEAETYPSHELFHVLRTDPEAAGVSFSVDDGQGMLSMNGGRGAVAKWDLADKGLCGKVADEIGSRLGWRGIEVVDHGFSPLWDFEGALLSVVNLGSIESLAEVAGMELDPRRFRANILIEGLEPWKERGWLGTDVAFSGGLRLRVVREIPRCRATCVNPDTTEVDVKIPPLLRKAFGHDNMGVLAVPLTSGRFDIGDQIA